MTNVIIHINKDDFSDNYLSDVTDLWDRHNLKPTWHTSETYLTLNEIMENLRSGDFIISAIPLDLVPVALHQDIIIGALSQRENCSYQLVIRNEMYDTMRDLRLKPLARVYVNTDHESVQLKNLNSDIDIHFIQEEKIKKSAQYNSSVDAILNTQNHPVYESDISGFQKITLHVSEMVPKAGAGVMAFLCHKEDLNTRRILKSVHQKNVAACTNIERLCMEKTHTFLKYPLSVHIEFNHHGHYSAYVFGILKSGVSVKFNRTQSTSAGLVEYIYTKIESEFLNC